MSDRSSPNQTAASCHSAQVDTSNQNHRFEYHKNKQPLLPPSGLVISNRREEALENNRSTPNKNVNNNNNIKNKNATSIVVANIRRAQRNQIVDAVGSPMAMRRIATLKNYNRGDILNNDMTISSSQSTEIKTPQSLNKYTAMSGGHKTFDGATSSTTDDLGTSLTVDCFPAIKHAISRLSTAASLGSDSDSLRDEDFDDEDFPTEDFDANKCNISRSSHNLSQNSSFKISQHNSSLNLTQKSIKDSNVADEMTAATRLDNSFASNKVGQKPKCMSVSDVSSLSNTFDSCFETGLGSGDDGAAFESPNEPGLAKNSVQMTVPKILFS